MVWWPDFWYALGASRNAGLRPFWEASQPGSESSIDDEEGLMAAGRKRKSKTPTTSEERRWMSKKVSHLQQKEGMSLKQAVAVAYSLLGEKRKD